MEALRTKLNYAKVRLVSRASGKQHTNGRLYAVDLGSHPRTAVPVQLEVMSGISKPLEQGLLFNAAAHCGQGRCQECTSLLCAGVNAKGFLR